MIDANLHSRGIGGSEVAAIVGLDPRRDAFAVYADKLGLVERAAPSPRMVWGKRIERVIAEAYGQETQQDVRWCDETLPHDSRPWQIMTPDAFVWQRNPIGGVDAKNVAFDQAYLWGDDKANVPDHIALQCQWYMSASTLPWWDVAALFGGHDLRINRVHFDAEVEAVLLTEAEKFWRNHIEARVPPPIGASNTAAEYLRQRFPKHVQALRPATEEETALLLTLRQARAEFDEAEREKKAIENAVKQAIGEAEGLMVGKDKVIWRRCKDTTGTDWEAVARQLGEYAPQHGLSLDEIVGAHQIVTREGARKLLCPRSWGKEEL